MIEKKILIVATNTAQMNDLNKTPTGVWLEEFAVPFLEFKKASSGEFKLDIIVASPLGGKSPVDEASIECKNPTVWDSTIKELENTAKLSEVNYKSCDAIFIPGGHGPMFDLASDKFLGEVVSYFFNTHKIVSAVCHGPAGLINAKTETGEPIVKGMQLTCFSNKEEKLVQKDILMPFLLESKLRHLGAFFNEAYPWQENVIVDRNLITGQNPASAKRLAEVVLKKLKTY